MDKQDHPLAGLRAWILSDGKAGDRVQCLGVAGCLGLEAEEKLIQPGRPWRWLLPWCPIPPGHKPHRQGSPIAPPFPDIAIATGKRLPPYLVAIKRASSRKTFTVFLKDPRLAPSCADLVWAPWHDKLRGPNVVVTATAPHNIRQHTLEQMRQQPLEAWAPLPEPRMGLVIGNPLARARNTQAATRRFLDQVEQIKGQVGSLLVVGSRRTPQALMQALRKQLQDAPNWVWSGEGENPYLKILACSDMLAVTADSHNMVGEALATGRPVYAIRPLALRPKLDSFLQYLEEHKLARQFTGSIEPYECQPVDATQEIADAIVARMGRA